MRSVSLCLVALCLVSWHIANGQSSTPTAIPPSAQSILTLAVAAAGVSSPITTGGQFTADGLTTLYAPGEPDPVSAHLSLSGAGTTQLTVNAKTGIRITTYAGTTGTFSLSNVYSQPLSTRTSSASRFLYLPMLELAEIATDPNAVLTLVSPAPVNGHTAYALTVTEHWTDLSLADSPPISVVFFVDSATYNIVARQDSLFDLNDNKTGYDRVIGYEDYRASGSFMVPFSVTETIAGQLLSSTKWTTLTAAL